MIPAVREWRWKEGGLRVVETKGLLNHFSAINMLCQSVSVTRSCACLSWHCKAPIHAAATLTRGMENLMAILILFSSIFFPCLAFLFLLHVKNVFLSFLSMFFLFSRTDSKINFLFSWKSFFLSSPIFVSASLPQELPFALSLSQAGLPAQTQAVYRLS